MNVTYPMFHISTLIIHGRGNPEGDTLENRWRMPIQTTHIGNESGVPALMERVRDAVGCRRPTGTHRLKNLRRPNNSKR